jgi:hypothetical protein
MNREPASPPTDQPTRKAHPMRSLLLGSLSLLVVGILVVACSYADPSQCFPNTGNGFGGASQIPIGAGVGVGSGDMRISPPRFPLGYGAQGDPCNTPSDQPTPAPPAEGTSSSGTGTPPCNQVLIGPPVTPTGSSGAGGSGAGGAGASPRQHVKKHVSTSVPTATRG